MRICFKFLYYYFFVFVSKQRPFVEQQKLSGKCKRVNSLESKKKDIFSHSYTNLVEFVF